MLIEQVRAFAIFQSLFFKNILISGNRIRNKLIIMHTPAPVNITNQGCRCVIMVANGTLFRVSLLLITPQISSAAQNTSSDIFNSGIPTIKYFL
jgi:hypothetical protein